MSEQQERADGVKMEEYLTVSEFAKQAGVTRQAVYQRLDKDLKEFVKVDNGIKYLSISSLDAFKTSKPLQQEDKGAGVYTALLETVNQQSRTIDTLTAQIEVKDKQIQALMDALAAAQRMAEAEQALHAGTIQKQLTDGGNEEGEAKTKRNRLRNWLRR